jgi:hypothetical protein
MGCVVMSIALLVSHASSLLAKSYKPWDNTDRIPFQFNGALPLGYPNDSNRAADYACIVFIFFYTFGYSLGFGPTAWVYGSEVFPTQYRARGLNLAASGGSIGSIIAAQTWPVGISSIGSKTYFIFMAINLASLLVSRFHHCRRRFASKWI